MSPLVATEVVIAALCLLVLLVIVATLVRRRALAGHKALMPCAMRTPESRRWRLGFVRFGRGTLEWFPLAGVSLRAERTWQRPELDLGLPTEVTELVPGLPDAVSVTAQDGQGAVQLAIAPGNYTAVRSWAESAPPGHTSYVA
ncbi:DUF2550 family protein [Janibacter sp. G1551]|uniref:DUF2550 family protein n=1 Tax=Janibacter sp. G1551 TaxID=3420440 RepID=UPI003D087336